MLSSQEVLKLSDKEPTVLYLNIVVQDATEAVEEKVKQKLANKKIPKPFRAVVASRAARAASGIASPPMIASMLGEKIPQKMIDLMEEKGITVAMDEVFREGPYVVFQIQVIKVDAVLLAQSKKKDTSETGYFEMGSFVGFGLGLIGSNNQQWVEEGYLPKLVQKKLQTAMGELLSEKLEKKKMVAETSVLGEAKQARYFFAKYREIQSLKPVGFSNRIRNASSNNSQGGHSQARRNSSNNNTSQGPIHLRRNSSGLTVEKADNGETSGAA